MANSSPIKSTGAVPSSMSLEELCELHRRDALAVRSLSLATAEQEQLYIRRFFDYLGPPGNAAELFEQLSEARVSSFLADYADRYGPGSRRWMLCSLRAFFRFAYHRSFVDRDLSGLVPSAQRRAYARVPRCLPDECISALQNGIPIDTPEGIRDNAIVWMLATYGVRGVQVRRLRLDDVNWRQQRMHFAAAKNGQSVDVHLTPEVGNRLADYIVKVRPRCDCPELFLTADDPPGPLPSSAYLARVLSRRMKELGLDVPEGVSRGAHGFRHAFATRMVGKTPFKDVVDLLGHRKFATTLIYARVDVEKLKKAALPWPGGW